MDDWQEWFAYHANTELMNLCATDDNPRVEDMYQVFKARMMDELGICEVPTSRYEAHEFIRRYPDEDWRISSPDVLPRDEQ